MKPERDIYFQKALEEGYLARSAYKLLQIDEVFNIFKGVTKAIDLCSAPGSWTQVICNKLHGTFHKYEPSKLNPNVKIVSVDMMPMDHFPGVIHLQADISKFSTLQTIIDQFNGDKVDIIVCDGAIDVVGMNMIDYFMHHRIFLAALYVVLNSLKTEGTFIMKIFTDKGYEKMVEKLKLFFERVDVVKPHCSRNKEVFAVCQDFTPFHGFDPIQLTPFIELKTTDYSKLTVIHKELIPYLCGDFHMPECINEMRKDTKASEVDICLMDMINSILKDVQDELDILKKRVLEKPIVYQITKDGHLKYDPETTKFLFQDLTYNTNATVYESGVATDDTNLNNSNGVCANKVSLIPLKSDCTDIEKERSKISTILGEKIKNIETQNKGKFSGAGFNLDNWEFFAVGESDHAIENMTDVELQGIYKGIREMNKSLNGQLKHDYIKELFMKQENLKSKIRDYFFKSDEDDKS